MQVIDKINGSALFAQSAYSAATATKDNLGRDITATYLTAINIPESATWNDVSETVQTNSAQWGQGGGGSVSSKYGTITVDGNDIEATNKALEFKSEMFISSFEPIPLDEYNSTASIAWNNYSQGTTLTLSVYNMNMGDNSGTITYSSNTNVTGLITASQWTPTTYVSLSLPNATAVQFSTNHRYDLRNIQVTAASSFQVSELAWKKDLPTYEYDRNRRVSAINGNALVGNEDYILEKGFVQNLTSPNGTIVVKGNKIEGTNSAVKGDVIGGFVSAYNDVNVYPGNSATLTWANYAPNATLTISTVAHNHNDVTLTYSSNTNVTGTITLLYDDAAFNAQGSLELPTDSTSIVIGEDNNYYRYNFTVSAEGYYEVGELAWASALPTYEYDNTNKISAINGSALAGGGEVPEDVMVESAIGYNAVGEISAYNGSALTDVSLNNIVQTNSGAWGGSALPISAGNGIGLTLVDGVLVISVTGGN